MPNRKTYIWNCGRYKLRLGHRTYLMGILNITPDSFSDGGRFFDKKKAIDQALKMVDEGVDIIDIGGESTRPGSCNVSLKEELERVVPVIKKLTKKIGVPISIDTTKSAVASAALDSGTSIVNDISGLRFDLRMPNVLADYKAGCIIMHIKGTPKTMQLSPRYSNLLDEITNWLRKSVSLATNAGVSKKNIVVDPGIGFGKTLKHNLEILKGLEVFNKLDFPILVGPSRKSFIGKILDLGVDERLMGTAASCAYAIINGAHVLRVHDVGKISQVAKMIDAIIKT